LAVTAGAIIGAIAAIGTSVALPGHTSLLLVRWLLRWLVLVLVAPRWSRRLW
jgi:hypothetical protein